MCQFSFYRDNIMCHKQFSKCDGPGLDLKGNMLLEEIHILPSVPSRLVPRIN